MLHPCHCTAHISSHLSSFPSSQTFYILLTPSVTTKRLLQVSVVSLCTVCSPWDIFNSVFFQYVFDDNVFKKGNKIIFKKVSLLIIMIFYIYIFLYLPNICIKYSLQMVHRGKPLTLVTANLNKNARLWNLCNIFAFSHILTVPELQGVPEYSSSS